LLCSGWLDVTVARVFIDGAATVELA
jgi:hypothetical protein